MTEGAISSTDSARLTGDAAVLARRYAGALYDLAQEQKQLDAIAADMRFIHQLTGDSAEFMTLANHPRITPNQRMAAVQTLSASAKFGSLTTNFLGLLARNQRLGLIRNITSSFLDRLAAERGEFTAEVTSARTLTAAQQEQLAARLHQWAGGNVHLSMRQDPALLGGLVIKMGSKVIDASVRNILERLERQLTSEQTIVQKGAA